MLSRQVTSILVLLAITSVVLAACSGPAQAPVTPVPAAQATTAPATPTSGSTAATAAPAADAGGPYRVGIFSDLKTINYWNYLGPGATVWSGYYLNPQRIAPLGLADKTFALVPAAAEALPERPLKKEGEFWVSELKLKQGLT